MLLLSNFLLYYQIKQGLTWLSNSFTSLKTQLSLELCFFMLRKSLVRPMTSCVPLNQITFRLANRDMIVFFMNTKTTKIPLKATKKNCMASRGNFSFSLLNTHLNYLNALKVKKNYLQSRVIIVFSSCFFNLLFNQY